MTKIFWSLYWKGNFDGNFLKYAVCKPSQAKTTIIGRNHWVWKR